ncbi:RNA polymerase sigma factor ShbA [Kineococcus gypseus]|uniref:RNA polymerase sigma factor ShbA n=1 Tax=Kineococcus gypseus TaxID=1637102 RepID=UPI003D7D0BAE
MGPGGDEAGGPAGADAARRSGRRAAPADLAPDDLEVRTTALPPVPREGAPRDGARVDGAPLDGARVDGTHLDGARVDGVRVDGVRVDADGPDGAGPLDGDLDPAGAPGVTPQDERAMSRVDAGGLQELAARALSGEQGAVADLLAAVRRLVHRYCRARLGRLPGADHAAEDAAQEVCIAVLTALPRYKDTGRPFEAFVYRIAANKVADAQRAAYRAPVPTDEVPDSAAAEPGPEQLAMDSFDAETVGRLLDTLPPKLREILTLRVGAGMSAEETGRALDMTAGAVRVAQHRAMQKLRKTALADTSLRVTS